MQLSRSRFQSVPCNFKALQNENTKQLKISLNGSAINMAANEQLPQHNSAGETDHDAYTNRTHWNVRKHEP